MTRQNRIHKELCKRERIHKWVKRDMQSRKSRRLCPTITDEIAMTYLVARKMVGKEFDAETNDSFQTALLRAIRGETNED